MTYELIAPITNDTIASTILLQVVFSHRFMSQIVADDYVRSLSDVECNH